MQYGSTPNHAVNLLKADIGLCAEAHAAHRRHMRKNRRASGLRNVNTAPGLDVYREGGMPCVATAPSLDACRKGSDGNLSSARNDSMNRMFSFDGLRQAVQPTRQTSN